MADTITWAENGLVEIDAATVHRWLSSDLAVLVAVREEWEFAEEPIPGAINMPLPTFDAHRLPADDGRRLVLACGIGRRSARAADIMLAAGYDKVTHLSGGMLSWEVAGFKTLSGEPEKDNPPGENCHPDSGVSLSGPLRPFPQG